MAIPKYHEMYQPFLDIVADGKLYSLREIRDRVAKVMGVTEAERKEMLTSGKQTIYNNRINWTGTYLKKAGLVERPSKGMFSISIEGKALLAENPAIIDDALLMRYDTFREFKKPVSRTLGAKIENESENTPQDQIDHAFNMINASIADDLLSEILKQSPDFFEMLVVKLLEKMGYGGALDSPGIVVGRSGDEGIDGIIREDKLGFNMIYIQAKRWGADKTVGRPDLQRFVGALADKKRGKGLFITTAQFSKEAIDYAGKQQVILIDGKTLTKLMLEYNLGVSVETVYELKSIDTDFFNNED